MIGIDRHLESMPQILIGIGHWSSSGSLAVGINTRHGLQTQKDKTLYTVLVPLTGTHLTVMKEGVEAVGQIVLMGRCYSASFRALAGVDLTKDFSKQAKQC